MDEGVTEIREVLLHEFQVGVRTAGKLFERIGETDWEHRPSENMRSVRELALHLAQVPVVDLAIMRETHQEAVRELERTLSAPDGPGLARLMERGAGELAAHFRGLSEADFLARKTKAFYAEEGSTQARWLVETVTHVFHHRAQLFNYLKQRGHDLNMFDLY